MGVLGPVRTAGGAYVRPGGLRQAVRGSRRCRMVDIQAARLGDRRAIPAGSTAGRELSNLASTSQNRPPILQRHTIPTV